MSGTPTEFASLKSQKSYRSSVNGSQNDCPRELAMNASHASTGVLSPPPNQRKEIKMTKTTELAAMNIATNNIISGLKTLREDFASADKQYLDGAENLYNLVGQIYDFYRQVIADKDSIKRFNKAFTEQKLGGKEDAGIERKVLRVATNGIKRMTENRYKTYARVMKAAYEEKIHEHIAAGGFKSFADWVKQMGGFEGITRATEPKDANDAAEALEQAKRFYANTKGFAIKTTKTKKLPATDEAKKELGAGGYFIALVRCDDAVVVDTIATPSLVNNTIKASVKRRSKEVEKWVEEQSIATNRKIINAKTGEEVSAEEVDRQLEAA